MVARMLLPALGGSPAVWNTCMVFFQAALLAGYAYAYGVSSWLLARLQLAAHAVLVFAVVLVLPISLVPGSSTLSPPSNANPVVWLLATLLATIGLPFFVIATTSPLLQRWFARTGEHENPDPYFLYGASNLGSMSALLGYPLIVEPRLRLAHQSAIWSGGYVALALSMVACGIVVWRSRLTCSVPHRVAAECRSAIGLVQWFRWVGLAFVPSSLMLGVTTCLCTDIAAIPLLWVVPLALYLVTFIVVFARRPVISSGTTARLVPVMACFLAWLMIIDSEPGPGLMLIHLATFFVVALACHGALAADRPSVEGLTSFYLAMSLGGVLGGVFTALVAPVAFDRVLEYPLALVLGCLVLQCAAVAESLRGERVRDLAWPCAFGLATAVVGALLHLGPECRVVEIAWKPSVGVALVAAFVAFRDRPARLALALGGLLTVGAMFGEGNERVLHRERSFFGVLKVTEDPRDGLRRLVHGNTLHGQQSLEPARRGEPLAYYHRTGPIGDVFEVFSAQAAGANVGVVGLGVGSLACYAREGQSWTFYEIDPGVARIARDARSFTFLSDCLAGPPSIVLGDARLRLRDAVDGGFGMLVLDAFSSDAIPVHLLTREALRLYRGKLAQGGLIAMHISN